jgi:hypothetical protein
MASRSAAAVDISGAAAQDFNHDCNRDAGRWIQRSRDMGLLARFTPREPDLVLRLSARCGRSSGLTPNGSTPLLFTARRLGALWPSRVPRSSMA